VVKVPANSGEVQVLEGVWEGALDANGTTLHLRFNFTKTADGSIAGTIDSLDQKDEKGNTVTGIPITSMSRTGDTVKLDVKMIGGGYEATINKDASSMTGTWKQGPGTLPLTLQRKKS
jgi:uncharacterized protein